MLIPPSFNFSGNKDRAISLRSQAHHLYNFVSKQAEDGGINFFSRTFKLDDGSLISIRTSKEDNYGLRTGHIKILGAGIEPSEIFNNCYITSAYNNSNTNRKIYTSLSSTILKQNFHTGNNYWIEKDSLEHDQLAISWLNGFIYIGGKYCYLGNVVIVAATYDRLTKKLIILHRPTSSNTISLNIYSIDSKTEVSFAVTNIYTRDVTIPVSTTLLTIFGFKTDSKTLYLKASDSTGSIQFLLEYIYNSDYTLETSTILWSGHYRVKQWVQDDISVYDLSLPGIPLVSETGNISLNSEVNDILINVFIDRDNIDVIFYSGDSETITRNMSKVATPFNETRNYSHNRSFSYKIKHIINSTLINVGPIFSGTTSLIKTYQQTISGDPSSVSYNYYYNTSFDIPVYVNSSKNIYIYENRQYTYTSTQAGISVNSGSAFLKININGNIQTLDTINYSGINTLYPLLQYAPYPDLSLPGGTLTINTNNTVGNLKTYTTQWTLNTLDKGIQTSIDMVDVFNYGAIVPLINNCDYAYDGSNLLFTNTLVDALTSINDSDTTLILDTTKNFNSIKYTNRLDKDLSNILSLPITVTNLNFNLI